MVGLPVLAFWLPATHNDTVSVAPDVSRGMKVEAQHAATIRANRLQVTQANPAGGAQEEGQVTWRTLFGVEFGTTTFEGASVRTELDYPTFGAVWALFLVAEVGLAACVLYLRAT